MPPPPSAFADALVLTGPTGSGKSALAVEVAERIGGEIVAMDSMTLYRGLDIGTAKPTPSEQARVPHHLIDVLDPWESGSVAWWLDRAAEACEAIRGRGRRPVFVGGTPFYLKSLLCGLFDSPPTDPAIRAHLEEEASRVGPVAFHTRLAEVDPVTANRLHPNDVRRVVRALEVWELTGRPICAFQTTWDSPGFSIGASRTPGTFPAVIPCVVIEWNRQDLYRRIDTRVDEMLAKGWLDEVRRILFSDKPLSKEASQALGYRELIDYVRGLTSEWPETVSRIKAKTRQFAKRQMTWFRHLPGLVAVQAEVGGLTHRVVEIFCREDSTAIQ